MNTNICKCWNVCHSFGFWLFDIYVCVCDVCYVCRCEAVYTVWYSIMCVAYVVFFFFFCIAYLKKTGHFRQHQQQQCACVYNIQNIDTCYMPMVRIVVRRGWMDSTKSISMANHFQWLVCSMFIFDVYLCAHWGIGRCTQCTAYKCTTLPFDRIFFFSFSSIFVFLSFRSFFYDDFYNIDIPPNPNATVFLIC